VRNYFDDAGGEIVWPGRENLIAIARAQLSRIPLAVGVAAGVEKARAILGAARSGMVNALVIDLRAAQAMMEVLDAGPGPEDGK
jgi:DNA-binding transcriptional regulator LsrR (DeoR family)